MPLLWSSAGGSGGRKGLHANPWPVGTMGSAVEPDVLASPLKALRRWGRETTFAFHSAIFRMLSLTCFCKCFGSQADELAHSIKHRFVVRQLSLRKYRHTRHLVSRYKDVHNRQEIHSRAAAFRIGQDSFATICYLCVESLTGPLEASHPLTRCLLFHPIDQNEEDNDC